MSECIIITEPQGAFCHRHHCFLTQVDELCSVARMASEVERLTAALADRDRRIEKALAYCDDLKPSSFAWRIQRILEGES